MSTLLFYFSSLILTFVFLSTHSIEDNSIARQEDGLRGLRNVIIEDQARFERKNKRFSKFLPCVASFLNKHMERSLRTSLVVIDPDFSVEWFCLSLVAMLDKFVFFTRIAEVPFPTTRKATGALVVMPNASSLEDNLYILEPCDRACPFVVVFANLYREEKIFLEDAEVITRWMELRRISTLAILATVNDKVLAAGSVHYTANEPCTLSPPIVLDECLEGCWDKWEKLKAAELNGCILKLAYFDIPPMVIAVNGSEKLLGFEGMLLEEVMGEEKIERERAEWNSNTTFAEQVEVLLYTDIMADLVIGGILQQVSDDVSYSTAYDMSPVVWVIPKVPNVSLQGLVQPFHPYVWAAIAGALLLGGLVKGFLSREITWLDLFALVIGVTATREPTRLSSRIQFLSWSIYGLFLTQFYVNELAGELMNVSDLKIKSMEELLSSSFKIGGTTALASLIDEFEDDDVKTRIRETFVTFDQDDYIEQLQDLLAGRNNTFALIAAVNSSRSRPIETVYAYVMTSEIVCSFPLALATWNGFPGLLEINTKILQFVQTGVLGFMIENAIAMNLGRDLANAEEEQRYKTELHLQQFIPAFLLIVIGFSAGFVLFVLEIIFYPTKFLR